jgi:hypothetical protein
VYTVELCSQSKVLQESFCGYLNEAAFGVRCGICDVVGLSDARDSDARDKVRTAVEFGNHFAQ